MASDFLYFTYNFTLQLSINLSMNHVGSATLQHLLFSPLFIRTDNSSVSYNIMNRADNDIYRYKTVRLLGTADDPADLRQVLISLHVV